MSCGESCLPSPISTSPSHSPTCFAPPPLGADVEQWLHLKWQLPLDAPRVGPQLGCFFPAFMAPQRSLKWATPTDRSAVCFDILIVASFGNIVWWPHCSMTFNVTICATFNCLPFSAPLHRTQMNLRYVLIYMILMQFRKMLQFYTISNFNKSINWKTLHTQK